ncbi:MAG: hypothetical protein IAI48_05775, partial [Candidatus Eremiobacteraeota bacterium]|nr:hypothetical protein [Candidatus Eremiobacteraeota bacterium]
VAARVRAAGIADREGGEFVVMRDAAPNPLPPELRVVREAPTYVVCELALDATARGALAALEEADAAVARAEEDVREMLSAETARAAPELERACAALGDLDSLVARAAFCARFACVVPDIDDGAFELIDARFPPLAEALAERNRPYVPISLALGGVAVVTGANMGGKTAALRTLGFAAACVALGVPVPAARARIPLFDEIVWLGVGAEAASGEESALLSAFGAELVALRSFLDGASGRALVLIDEFARTTAPREGRALLVALLETLRARGDVALAATHLSAVASAAGVDHYTIGRVRSLPRVTEPLALAAALERIGSAMDFALVRADDARVTASDAIELAGTLGLDAAFVARAEDVLRTSPE